MSVLAMVSAVAGFVKVRYLLDKAVIDNLIFRTHYRVTTAIFFLSCILVTANNLIGKWTNRTVEQINQKKKNNHKTTPRFIASCKRFRLLESRFLSTHFYLGLFFSLSYSTGDPINCIADGGVPEHVINTFCWITYTFSMPDRMTGQVGTHVAHPGLGPYGPEDRRIFHSYYQWVPFMLFFQVRLVSIRTLTRITTTTCSSRKTLTKIFPAFPSIKCSIPDLHFLWLNILN